MVGVIAFSIGVLFGAVVTGIPRHSGPMELQKRKDRLAPEEQSRCLDASMFDPDALDAPAELSEREKRLFGYKRFCSDN
jgi:hypothetical protein